jgi:hypothetical protein
LHIAIMKRIVDSTEANVVLFALLLNLPWELAQVPLFSGMPAAGHWSAIKVCGRATLGDGVIALVSFWAVAAATHNRRWILRPNGLQVSAFIASGVVITIVTEWLATGALDRWTYAQAMPTILGIGVAPLVQWIVLPPLISWFVRRQLT